MTILYHYTSLNAFCSIIKDQKLRLTKMNFLNDSMEYDCGLEFFKEEITEFENKNKVVDRFDLNLLDKFITKSSLFSISFCESGNDLNLWRGYCPEQGGISIGFDKDTIFPQNEIILNKCRYDNPYKGILTMNSYVRLKGKFNNIHTIYKDQEHIKFTFDLAHIKSKSFIDEKEWRGISFPNRNKIECLVRNSLIIPYFDFPYNKTSIKEIYIGPMRFQDKNREAIEMILGQTGIDCPIIKSEIPFVQY